MSSSTRSCLSGREPDVLGRVGKAPAMLVASVAPSPREADVRVPDATASGTRTGAAQCVRIAQPTREIVELLI